MGKKDLQHEFNMRLIENLKQVDQCLKILDTKVQGMAKTTSELQINLQIATVKMEVATMEIEERRALPKSWNHHPGVSRVAFGLTFLVVMCRGVLVANVLEALIALILVLTAGIDLDNLFWTSGAVYVMGVLVGVALFAHSLLRILERVYREMLGLRLWWKGCPECTMNAIDKMPS